FTPDEHFRFYLRIAEMMEANPSVKALASPSWWFDPALREISPELAHLRAVPESGGARFIPAKSDHLLTDSLAFSPKRKALYEAGAYKPKGLMMIWPRRALLAWAGRARRASQPEARAMARGEA